MKQISILASLVNDRRIYVDLYKIIEDTFQIMYDISKIM